jgi:hypothetical protein
MVKSKYRARAGPVLSRWSMELLRKSNEQSGAVEESPDQKCSWMAQWK